MNGNGFVFELLLTFEKVSIIKKDESLFSTAKLSYWQL
jgi:hypothetical protein